MASFAPALCRQTRSLSGAFNQNHFASRSSFVHLCLRNLATKMALPRVFFDMTADGVPVGRFIVEVSRFIAFLRFFLASCFLF